MNVSVSLSTSNLFHLFSDGALTRICGSHVSPYGSLCQACMPLMAPWEEKMDQSHIRRENQLGECLRIGGGGMHVPCLLVIYLISYFQLSYMFL